MWTWPDRASRSNARALKRAMSVLTVVAAASSATLRLASWPPAVMGAVQGCEGAQGLPDGDRVVVDLRVTGTGGAVVAQVGVQGAPRPGAGQ